MRIRTSFLFALSPLLAGALLLLALTALDPVASGPVGVLVVFGLIYLFWLSLFFVVLHYGLIALTLFIRKIGRHNNTKNYRLGARKAYYIATVIAFVPVILLAMRSFAQIRVMDVILIVLLTSVAVFFVVKR